MIKILGQEGPVAEGKLTFHTAMDDIKELPDVQLTLFYFAKINLHPTVVFRHLTGVPLKEWLDGCSLSLPTGETVGPLLYVHGRSEVMRGKHNISTVLLADVRSNELPSPARWLAALPSVYKRFTQVLDTSKPEKS